MKFTDEIVCHEVPPRPSYYGIAGGSNQIFSDLLESLVPLLDVRPITLSDCYDHVWRFCPCDIMILAIEVARRF